MGTGLPQKVMVKHKYCETFNTSLSVGQLTSFGWKANGMFAPSGLTGGHQPMYFDQYALLYNHYTVIGSKCTFTVSHISEADNPHTFRICAFLDDNSSLSAASMDAIAEATQARRPKHVVAEAGAPVVTKSTFSAKRVFGGSILAKDSLSGTGTSNPTELSYHVLAVEATPTLTAHFVCTVEIEYVAIWTELKEVAQS